MESLQYILKHKIVAIIRGVQPEDVLPIVEALYEGGVRALEITLNSPEALSVIERIMVTYGDKLLVGAGTVLDAADSEAAIKAGAKFIISPVVDKDTIIATKANGAVSIPGAFTPTEIVQAYKAGADIIKVFPASIGPEYIRDIRGPLPHIPLMPTGGVHWNNIKAFQVAGAVAFGIGSALVDAKQAVTAAYQSELSAKAKQFVDTVNMQAER